MLLHLEVTGNKVKYEIEIESERGAFDREY